MRKTAEVYVDWANIAVACRRAGRLVSAEALIKFVEGRSYDVGRAVAVVKRREDGTHGGAAKHLACAGFEVVVAEGPGSCDDEALKRLLLEPGEGEVVLISGDGGYSETVRQLRSSSRKVVVLFPADSTSAELMGTADRYVPLPLERVTTAKKINGQLVELREAS